MKTAMIVPLSILLAAAAWASEPGQPLNCSDWVFSEPGHYCSDWVPYPSDNAVFGYGGGATQVVDNEGRVYMTRMVERPPDDPSCYPQRGLPTFQVLRYDGSTVAVVAALPGRCSDVLFDAAYRTGSGDLHFDATNGALLVNLSIEGWHGQDKAYGGFWWASLHGFATTFDVLQTFTPQASLGFRVPYMPEGMPAADHFDTYWGDISTVGNWSQAHGLQCHYPAAQPARGDYLTVSDPLPTPQPGHGYYYVTAATYQGQTRYGRKTTASHVTGRDPALLPACSTEAQR